MKIRLKFRDKFHVHHVANADVELLELLQAISDLFRIDLVNVQISLNAKDYIGIHESGVSISEVGVVNGDIVYVKSLESLDDIRQSMERELSISVDSLYNSMAVSLCTVEILFTLPLYLFAIAKDLICMDHFPPRPSSAGSSVRMQFVYRSTPEVHISFTLFTTGNLICLAASSQELNLARQLILPTRDHLTVSSISDLESQEKPSLLLKHLRTLACRIKDELIEPMLVDIHAKRGMPERMTLSNLPTELLTRILLFVPLRSLGQLMLCSRHLCEEIKFCAPVWRMHLAQFNAKKQPLLDAALSRQQRQSQSQPRPLTPIEPHLDSNEPCSDLQSTIQSDTEDNVPTPDSSTQSYERFVTRYRSLIIQRRNRGLSPIFI
ncbi:hypothetical protein EG68_07409 [Paragonimus skrjabini miyazakii]|uniref:F-box domain-containing protein n=1 Tax=Paragonimus skrjabini miyazakii TaxID=59628 RepID=A0A8S9YK21_9TREM|nr:hypothetical protein EG68_07409 [Paragonimus skrjabini miyazakii]